MRAYKIISFTAAVIFAISGLILLFFPDLILIFSNSISGYFGLPKSPLQGTNFYLVLSSVYMYLVTLLAYQMYRDPEQNIYPFLLAHAKLASAMISIYLFVTHQPYLIYFVSFVLDGVIGITVLYMIKMKKMSQ